MLKVLSIIITAEVLADELAPKVVSFNVGLEKASTKKIMISILINNSKSCFSFIRLIFVFCNSFKKINVLNSTCFSLRRFRKCKTIGIEVANNPIKTAGFKNVILQSFLCND
jgi:hypothetical protein